MRVYTGEINGYMYSIEAPAYIVFEDSPMMVRVTMKNSDGTPAVGLRVQGVTTILGGDMFVDNFRYTDSQGVVFFDFLKIVKMMRRNDAGEELSRLEHHTLWRAELGTWRFFAGGGELPSTVQFTVASGRLALSEIWRNKPLYVKWWRNYPFTFDYPNQETIGVKGYKSLALGALPTSAQYSMMRVDPAQLPYVPNNGSITYQTVTTGFKIERGELVDDVVNEIVVEIDDCTDAKGVYLRWVGQHDEVFYWLFKGGDENMSIKSETYAKSMYIGGYGGMRDNLLLLNDKMRTIEEVKVIKGIHTDYVSERYYYLLASLAYSPAVDMYEGDGYWRRVLVEDVTLSKTQVYSENRKAYRFNYNIILKS